MLPIITELVPQAPEFVNNLSSGLNYLAGRVLESPMARNFLNGGQENGLKDPVIAIPVFTVMALMAGAAIASLFRSPRNGNGDNNATHDIKTQPRN